MDTGVSQWADSVSVPFYLQVLIPRYTNTHTHTHTFVSYLETLLLTTGRAQVKRQCHRNGL